MSRMRIFTSKRKITISALLIFFLSGKINFALSTSNASHSLVDFSGKVEVKKTKWTKWTKEKSSFVLDFGDKVKIGKNSSITIRCSSLEKIIFKEEGIHRIAAICNIGQPSQPLKESNKELRPGDDDNCIKIFNSYCMFMLP